MGALDHLSNIFGSSGRNRHYRHNKQMQTVEIRVKIDCEGCERKVRRSVEGMRGVTSISIEPKIHKLTVTGYIEPHKVVSRVAHRTGKRAELWPYIPYDVVERPYAQGVYDRKAPSGYVRNTQEPSMTQASYNQVGQASYNQVPSMTQASYNQVPSMSQASYNQEPSMSQLTHPSGYGGYNQEPSMTQLTHPSGYGGYNQEPSMTHLTRPFGYSGYNEPSMTHFTRPSGYGGYNQEPSMTHLNRASSTEVRYSTALSDENTGSCAIM